jgi:hypothetical protein
MAKITERKIVKAINLIEAVSTEFAKTLAGSEDDGERSWAKQNFDTLQNAAGVLSERQLQAEDEAAPARPKASAGGAKLVHG